MATHLKIVLLSCLLVFAILMEDVKPALVKKGERLKQRTKILEETVRELNERMKEQEGKIKALEECKACSKIKDLNETFNELQEKIKPKPDIDECSSNSHSCDVNAVCSDTPGSYTCTCKAGFSGDGKTCVDIDECVSGLHNCHSSASCTNTEGSYNCSCNQPYTGDGKTCNLVSECQTYTVLNTFDRKDTHSTVQGNERCDALSNGWYRFDGAAGTRMPTFCVDEYRCGTNAPGWLFGEHPTQAEGQVTRRVCFKWNSECCYGDIDIKVRNCSSYYVYYLSSRSGCVGYCGTD